MPVRRIDDFRRPNPTTSALISSYFARSGASSGPIQHSYTPTYRSNGTAEGDLRQMYQQQLNDYNRYQQPVIDMLEDEANSTEIYDRAVDQADQLEGKVKSITDRQLATDSNALLPSQRKALNSNIKRKTSLGAGAMVTGGREAQRSKRVAARHAMMGIAESLQTTGIANTADAASKFEARKTAARNANRGMMGTIFGIAGGVIGSFAGPAGASAGASIGSAFGQSVGG